LQGFFLRLNSLLILVPASFDQHFFHSVRCFAAMFCDHSPFVVCGVPAGDPRFPSSRRNFFVRFFGPSFVSLTHVESLFLLSVCCRSLFFPVFWFISLGHLSRPRKFPLESGGFLRNSFLPTPLPQRNRKTSREPVCPSVLVTTSSSFSCHNFSPCFCTFELALPPVLRPQCISLRVSNARDNEFLTISITSEEKIPTFFVPSRGTFEVCQPFSRDSIFQESLPTPRQRLTFFFFRLSFTDLENRGARNPRPTLLTLTPLHRFVSYPAPVRNVARFPSPWSQR